MKKIFFITICFFIQITTLFANEKKYDIVVDCNGKGNFSTITAAINHLSGLNNAKKQVVVLIKNGFYKEKLELPAHISNVKFVGENRDRTIICYNDYASKNDMGTFRTYTFLVRGNDITFEDLTIENSAGQVGQAVALHTEGDRLIFRNCRLLGNQDTVYTGGKKCRLYFECCYIDGTTDFIFGPATAWFEKCELYCKRKSYITAASTPEDVLFGYVFNNCTIAIAEDIPYVYLGRPWRPYAMTLFMNCYLSQGIAAEGWDNWRNPENEKTARYMEYNNRGAGANTSKRVDWAKKLTKKEAKIYTVKNIMKGADNWNPQQQK